ncbi:MULTISPECIES: PAS domain-containing protein [Enterobacteriaceae]|nr:MULTISPECIES: PAS domain-containing protein [Enterobacteriaceae]MCT4723899.1 PAS domain-containing protein [Citrobacter freundii]MCT4749556.1 PAS domain-containing protein [Citrobacter freundii]MDT7126598.1 PAS domain-containing protein [Citrobacter freundii]MDT7140615.1 PAS domain-containing protein [Citrobacter freundii]MDT7149357.1 PAS domain-containing protein [Citrobacter freundii]
MRQNLPVTGRNLELPKDANILSTTSPQSHITYVNPDFIKISGFTEEELLGQPHNIVRHPDMPPAAFEHMWSTLKSGRSWMGLVKNRCKNGDHYWVSAYVTPIAKNGSIVEYQSVRTKPEPEQVLAAEKLYAPHIMRLLISLWDVGTVFFTIYPQVFRHEKSSIYYKYIEPLSYCFSISFKILIITVYGFMKWYICKCLFCKVYLLDLSYNRNAKPMTGSNELRFNLTQIRG